jgi:hypothetical protein
MRCADVNEELTASAEPASAALTEHLAGCPACAARVERDARLFKLWEATRPQEPTPEAWATVWGMLTRELATPAPVVPMAPVRPWQRWAPATFGIAQAAAFLAGAVWVGFQPSLAPVAIAKVEIPVSDGALVIIQTDGTDPKVISLVADEGSNTIDGEGFGALVEPSFVMLGKLEAMAE